MSPLLSDASNLGIVEVAVIGLVVITDGRLDCLERTLLSFVESLKVGTGISDYLLIDDSADVEVAAKLDERWPAFRRIHHTERRGFCGAIQSAWANLGDVEYVFHLEDDFLFQPDGMRGYLTDLSAMVEVLEAHPYLDQLAFRRQPWNDAEKAAGGYVELWPDEYIDRTWNGFDWLEHRLFFTTNPSLYRRSLADAGWPNPPGCESEFTRRRLQDPAVRFGIWGRRQERPRVHHIGEVRAGVNY